MKYARSPVKQGALVALEPSGWGLPYQALHDQTDASGWEMYLLESSGNFNNPFAQAMRAVYERKGWFGLILRDVVSKSEKGTDDKERLHLRYVSHASTEWERKHEVWAPREGWYVPNADCEKINDLVVPFQQGTLVPFETVETKREAIRRFEAFGIDSRFVSHFYRPRNYDDSKRFAGPFYSPGYTDEGRFDVGLDVIPSVLGNVHVASLPAYKGETEPEIVM